MNLLCFGSLDKYVLGSHSDLTVILEILPIITNCIFYFLCSKRHRYEIIRDAVSQHEVHWQNYAKRFAQNLPAQYIAPASATKSSFFEYETQL